MDYNFFALSFFTFLSTIKRIRLKKCFFAVARKFHKNFSFICFLLKFMYGFSFTCICFFHLLYHLLALLKKVGRTFLRIFFCRTFLRGKIKSGDRCFFSPGASSNITVWYFRMNNLCGFLLCINLWGRRNFEFWSFFLRGKPSFLRTYTFCSNNCLWNLRLNYLIVD